MKTINDILYVKAENPDDTGTLMLALGINGDVVYLLSTYVDLYELLISSTNIEENLNAPQGEFWIDIKKDGELLDTWSVTEELSALFRSSPDIIELGRAPLPPVESLGDLRFIDVGWKYDANFNITPPAGWTRPLISDPVSIDDLTEEQKVILREKGHNI